ncbi:MAG: hypothetical protein ACREA2_24315 [Blastocatellia bacterium]
MIFAPFCDGFYLIQSKGGCEKGISPPPALVVESVVSPSPTKIVSVEWNSLRQAALYALCGAEFSFLRQLIRASVSMDSWEREIAVEKTANGKFHCGFSV